MLETNKVILCAIAKNEAPYLVEWIAYHKYIIGFDQIIIYENDSNDDSKFLLEELQKLDICLYYSWPRKSGFPPQQSAYNHAIKTQNKLYKWICFLDLDEFLVLKDFSSVQDCISHFENKADTILVNWRMFGSSGHEKYDPSPLIQRLTKCLDPCNPVQSHMKSISKIDQIQDVDVHISRLKGNSRYFHIDETEICYGDKPQIEHVTNRKYRSYKSGQINHYFLKSLEEFKCKIMKGTASVSDDHPESRFRKVDFQGLDPTYNLAEEFVDFTTVNELNNRIDSIYESIGGKDTWVNKFRKFIEFEAKRYDSLQNSNDNINLHNKSRINIPKNFIVNTPLWAPGSVGKISEFLASCNSTNVLEFGSAGESTIWLSNYKVNLITIEHDVSRFTALKNKLDERKITNVSVLLRKLPYSNVVDEFPDNYFDLILVSGRNRNDCIKASIKKVKDGGWLVLNDAQRTRYREGRNFLEAFPCVRYHHPHRYTQIWFIRNEIDYLNLAVNKSF